MKIIERGIAPREYVYRMRCRTCASLLQYSAGDISGKINNQRDGATHTLSTKCPVCNDTLVDHAPTRYIEQKSGDISDSYWNTR